MVEKGTQERNFSLARNMAIKLRGHVRVVKNSSLANPQGVPVSLSGKKIDAKSDGHAPVRKSGGSPVLLLSGSNRQACPSPSSPKLKGIGGCLSSSPSCCSREASPRTSPTLGCNYAGAKFSEPPSPDSLPKPPRHWMDWCDISSGSVIALNEITQQLKVILKVPA